MSGNAPPQWLARIGGFLYLLVIAGGLFGEIHVRGSLIVPGDAAATAANIQAHESLWRFGVATEILMLACSLVLTLILYVLLRPVSRDVALLAVFFNVVTITMEAVGDSQHLLAAMFPLTRPEALAAFTPEQLQALASLSLRSHAHAFGVDLIFFGFECLVLGWLIFRAGYFPKLIGVLMTIAGACYLINSFALLLAPPLASRLFPAILVPAFVGEASLCLWLLFKGVNAERWCARARGAD